MFVLQKGSDLNKLQQIEDYLSNGGEFGTGGNAGALLNFEKSATNEPAFSNTGNAVHTSCDLAVNISDSAYKFETGDAVQMPVLTIGTDYAIYATTSGLVASSNFTVPVGYTAENSRRIGGFHYGDNRIYPRSFWDLKFKPTCDDPRGMVRTYQGFWADIYLLNTTPDLLGTSAYNAQIADGASLPKIPKAWGGNGTDQYSSFSQYIATEVLSAFGKRLPNQHEFSVLSQGSLTGHANVTDPAKTVFDVSARSLIDCEQVSGHLSQWGAELWERGDGENGYGWRNEDTGGKGHIYAQDGLSVGAVAFGGAYPHAGHSGSRAVDWGTPVWRSYSYVSARGICDHYQNL